MIAAVDRNIGRIMAALARPGIAQDTLLIFTSDNGGTPQFTPPLRGSKGELYEGGIRVPMVIAGPGVAKPGTTCDTPIASTDVYPTRLELAGDKPPGNRLTAQASCRCSPGSPRL